MKSTLFVAALALGAVLSSANAAEPQTPTDTATGQIWFERALGLDLGAEGAPDAVRAFAAMRRSAESGDAEAAFNVAVMLDSGRGVARDTAKAAIWYARAAARGSRRAAYNLGLLYQRGEGVLANSDLSRAWYVASNLPAARERAGKLKPEGDRPEHVVAPTPIFPANASALEGDDQQVDLVWTSSLQPKAVRFFVELRELEPGRSKEVWSGFVDLSSVRLPLPPESRTLVWRVSAVARDPADYTVSNWVVFAARRSTVYSDVPETVSSGFLDNAVEHPPAVGSEQPSLQRPEKRQSDENEHTSHGISAKAAMLPKPAPQVSRPERKRESDAALIPGDEKVMKKEAASNDAPAARPGLDAATTDPAVLIILAQPSVTKLSDLNDKAVVIAGLTSVSQSAVSAALNAGGARTARLTEGVKSDIDKLVSGDIAAAIVACVTPSKAQSFPEIPGFRLLRVALNDRQRVTDEPDGTP